MIDLTTMVQVSGMKRGGEPDLDDPDENGNEFADGDGVLAHRFHLDDFIRRAGCQKRVTRPA